MTPLPDDRDPLCPLSALECTRLQAEARFDSAPSDLMSEGMAMLGQLGYGDAIEDVWIEELLAAQQEDGSFLWASGEEAGHPHPTDMAIWAFAGWLRSQP